MHHPTDILTHTTAFVIPVVEDWLEREIAQWVHSMKDRSDDPSHHERTLLPPPQRQKYKDVSNRLKNVVSEYNRPVLDYLRGIAHNLQCRLLNVFIFNVSHKIL